MRILITGGTGMVGKAFSELNTDHELITYGSKAYDLRDPDQVCDMFGSNKVDAVIHLAAKVGGVKGNSDYVADFFHENIMINTNVLNMAKNYKVPRVLSLLSTCLYPDNVTYPITEDQLHNGEPHYSNFGYAYAKRMLEVHSRAIRTQYGLNYTTAIPNNIYGMHDNFDLNNGHVIPAVIRKVYEAKITGQQPRFWGDGRPLRQFTFSVDIARALLWMIENYEQPQPLNIGSNAEISIYDLVITVQKILGVEQRSVWDDSFPSGQFKKPSTNKSFLKLNPSFKYTEFNAGLKQTISWFEKEYPNVRGI